MGGREKPQRRLFPDRNITLNDVYEMWKKDKKGLKQTTVGNYVYMYEYFVMGEFGKRQIQKIRKSDVLIIYFRPRCGMVSGRKSVTVVPPPSRGAMVSRPPHMRSTRARVLPRPTPSSSSAMGT